MKEKKLVVGGRLPEGFVLAKPLAQESYDESVIYELEKQGRLIITRKRDGWKMFAVVGSTGKVRLFTDGLNEVDSRFDHIRKELESLNLTFGTVLVGEAIVDLEGSDDVTKVISIFHSNTEKSIKFQEANGMAKFMVFGVLFLNIGAVQPLYWLAYQWLSERFYSCPLSYVSPAPVLKMSYDQAKKMVIEKEWEGLVLYDKNYILTYRTDGKNPKRPKGCYKWKPIMEDDFIVILSIHRPETGVLKELVLMQIDPANGIEFYCGRLGSFTNQMREELAKLKLPFVVQARFDTRFAKTGKIRNPRFVRVRDDKNVSGCVAPKSYPNREYMRFLEASWPLKKE